MISFGRNGTSGIQTGPWVPELSFYPTLFLMDKSDWRTTLLISIKKQTHISWNSLSSVPSPCRPFLRLPWSLGSLLQWHHQAGRSQRLLGPRGPALPGGGCVPQERGAAGGRQELQPSSAEDPEGEGSTGEAHLREEALTEGNPTQGPSPAMHRPLSFAFTWVILLKSHCISSEP